MYLSPGRLKGRVFPIVVMLLDHGESCYLSLEGVLEVVEVSVKQYATDISLARQDQRLLYST